MTIIFNGTTGIAGAGSVTGMTVANTAISGTITSSQLSTTAQYNGFKNRIVNGDMRIDQRNNGGSITPALSNIYSVDRWKSSVNPGELFSMQRNAGSVTPPTGFTNYLGCTSTATTTLGATQFALFGQAIEGYNIADLAWGTANAKTVTVSFWVRSSLTGTFGGALLNDNQNYNYGFSYTISAANTWEQKSVTISGPTSGTWNTDSNTGIKFFFSLGCGSTYSGTAGVWTSSTVLSVTGATSVVGTSGATLYITGIQMEVGSSATAFDMRDIGREFIMCQRYYQTVDRCMGMGNYYGSSAQIQTVIPLPVTMRAAPTPSATGALNFTDSGANYTESSLSIPSTYMTPQGGVVYFGNFSGITAYRPYWYQISNSSSRPITMDAEL